MPTQFMPIFLSALAFGIQFLIFVYLYSSHRVLFFRYLVWAWGFFTLSRGLRLLRVFVPGTVGLTELLQAASVMAVFCVLSAGPLYRWDYRLKRRDVLISCLLALAIGILGDFSKAHLAIRAIVGLVLGGALIAAGRAFWPRAAVSTGYRGDRLLATSLCLWGVHRIGAEFVHAEPGSTLHLAVHTTFITLYFLSTFAIVIMVLDRARSEMRSLKELNEPDSAAATYRFCRSSRFSGGSGPPRCSVISGAFRRSKSGKSSSVQGTSRTCAGPVLTEGCCHATVDCGGALCAARSGGPG